MANEKLQQALVELEIAVEFYEQCDADRSYAEQVGAMKDAHEWLYDKAKLVTRLRKEES